MKNIQELKQQYDTSDMYSAVHGFPDQIDRVADYIRNWNARHDYQDIHTILVLGMGGSAIGGDVTRVMVQNDCPVPILVNRSYNIPHWVNKHTLILASSYSGNTEETLSAYVQCRTIGAPMVVLSTGGAVTEWAVRDNLDLVVIPAGLQPRAALGFSFANITFLLNKLGFVPDVLIEELLRSAEVLRDYRTQYEIGAEDNYAVEIAEQIHRSIPVIYGSEDMTWVAALRFRGQLAENAKMLAFHHHIPEQNHNEIEGWSCNEDLLRTCGIIWFKDLDDHERSLGRMEVSSELLAEKAGYQISLDCDGESRIERLLKLIHLTDWVSYYAALLNETDPTPVTRISLLKDRMSKL